MCTSESGKGTRGEGGGAATRHVEGGTISAHSLSHETVCCIVLLQLQMLEAHSPNREKFLLAFVMSGCSSIRLSECMQRNTHWKNFGDI